MSGGHTPEYMKAYGEANKERLIAYRKEYYKTHKEDILTKNKQIRERNKDKYSAKKKEYYEANKSKLNAKRKEYRDTNKDKIRIQKKIAHEKNRGHNLSRSKKHYHANKDKYIDRARRQYEADKKKHHAQGRAWAKANPQKMKEITRNGHKKARGTPKGHINSTISKRMNESLKRGMKAGRAWESLVGYTVDQLKQHIEKMFKPGMSWENYGKAWHIDHKIPVAVFNFEKPEDIDFRICWSLKNLQPLDAHINMSKGAKIEKPFQPSLAIGG